MSAGGIKLLALLFTAVICITMLFKCLSSSDGDSAAKQDAKATTKPAPDTTRLAK